RKQRKGRNPRTGAEITIPAQKVPFFRPSSELKNLVKK
ncbi:MAG: HU family DNA-binding protein, partial [candidate division WOR-3 bacterium]